MNLRKTARLRKSKIAGHYITDHTKDDSKSSNSIFARQNLRQRVKKLLGSSDSDSEKRNRARDAYLRSEKFKLSCSSDRELLDKSFDLLTSCVWCTFVQTGTSVTNKLFDSVSLEISFDLFRFRCNLVILTR